MAITALHISDAVVLPHRPFQPAGAEPAVLRHAPVAAVVAALAGLLEGVALLAAALTGLEGLLASAHRASGPVVVAVLPLLSAWIVLAAWGGATVLDGAGRRLFTGLAWAEIGLVATVLVAEVIRPTLGHLVGSVPLPLVALTALAVPVGKLLLGTAPSTTRWTAQGPRIREERPDPAVTHRRLCTGTLAVIGLALAAIAAVGPTGVHAGAATGPVSSTTTPAP